MLRLFKTAIPLVIVGSCVNYFDLVILCGIDRTQHNDALGAEKQSESPKRVPWTTSRITGSLEEPPPYTIERVFPKLNFQQPVDLARFPDSNRLVITQLDGKILSFENKPMVEHVDVLIDLKQEIEGMTRAYSLTFDPNFNSNRYCYICYILADKNPNGTRVSRFKVSKTNPPKIDPTSERVLLTWLAGGHNGGCLKFGPDGYLYISTGDGAGAFPPDSHKTGQNINDLLASVLRINVNEASGDKLYSIPSDNPFVDLKGARPEVWSYGHRNPWKMSFDPNNGALWVADVGWEMWEMVYRIQKGGNYGWSLVEGSQQVHPERYRGPTPVLAPTVQHSHTESRSITGGYVYTGIRLKELRGAYIYGDYVTGKIWGVRHDGQKVTSLKELADTPLAIICYGVDANDELLIVGYDGTIHQLVANVAAKANQDFPLKLSQTGLFSSVKDHDVAPGVTAYRINAEPWADHTLADRYIALPGTSQLGIHKTSNAQVGNLKGEWSFPTDSVLMKTISLEMEVGNPRSPRRLETQILHRDGDTWRAYSYIWKDDQTDAVLSPGQGLDRTFTVADPRVPGGRRNQVWHFASRTECILCHTTRAGTVHGFRIDQLNNSDQGNDDGLDQLNLLSELNLFSEPLVAGKPRNKWPRIVSPSDDSADINLRARAYLHVNCAHCHRRGGGGTAEIDVQFQHSIEKTNLLNARPTQGTFGVHRAGVVAAGAPHRSVLFIRMAKLGRGRMPYFGSSMVDEAGLQLIHDWIQQLPNDANGQIAAAAETTSRRLLQQLRTSSKQSVDSRAKLIGQLLSSTSSAMLLLAATGELTDPLEKELKKSVIAIATKHQNVEIRDIFERFVAEEHRVKRLGSVIDPKRILAIVGDRRRGKRLFETTAGVQCRNCHRIGTIGQQVGPDLSSIGKKYKRFQILENLLEPSKQIDEKFITYLVETTDGRVITGLLVEKNENKVVLKNATNKLVEISRRDIDVFVPTRKSLMPDLLLREMTAQQVADLLKFFSSLK